MESSSKPLTGGSDGHHSIKSVAVSVFGEVRWAAMKNIILLLLFLFLGLPLIAQGGKSAPADVVYPIREGFVDAHGVMIYYMSTGRGQPLMILHGAAGASHDYFLPYLLPLSRHHRVIFIDERGSGQSQKLENVSGYTIANMVEDVEAVR